MTRAPEHVRRAAAAHLRAAGSSAEHGRSLLVRIDRFWADLLEPLDDGTLLPGGLVRSVATSLDEVPAPVARVAPRRRSPGRRMRRRSSVVASWMVRSS